MFQKGMIRIIIKLAKYLLYFVGNTNGIISLLVGNDFEEQIEGTGGVPYAETVRRGGRVCRRRT